MFLNGLTKFKKEKKYFIYTEEQKLQKVIKNFYTGNNFHIKCVFKKYFITLFYMKNILCKLMV